MAWMKGEVVGTMVLAAELWGQSYSGGGNPVDGGGDDGESGIEGVEGERGQVLKCNTYPQVVLFPWWKPSKCAKCL